MKYEIFAEVIKMIFSFAFLQLLVVSAFSMVVSCISMGVNKIFKKVKVRVKDM